MSILPGDPTLHLIDLDQPLPGQRRFISCWVSVGSDVIYLVDPGPPGTAQYLLAKLEELDLPRLDFILLTHVHLDHGGATAAILQRWPEAKVICEPKGSQHIIDPQRLWEGSLQVLREKAVVYGEPTPVDPGSVVSIEALDSFGIEVIATPGHAPHHISFLHGSTLFLGEAAGTFSSLGQDSDTADYYLRPATPPRFFPAIALESLARLSSTKRAVDRLVFAHHGHYTGDTKQLLVNAYAQLELWLAVAGETLRGSGLDLGSASEPDLHSLRETTADQLLSRDLFYGRRSQLPIDIQQREQDYTHQTLRGIFGYLEHRQCGL